MIRRPIRTGRSAKHDILYIRKMIYDNEFQFKTIGHSVMVVVVVLVTAVTARHIVSQTPSHSSQASKSKKS